MRRDSSRERCGVGLALLVLVLALPLYAEEPAPPSADLNRLKEEAGMFERAGEEEKAAEVYEKIIAADPSTRKFLAQRLAVVYAATGNTNKCLAYAKEVMKEHPDPQAYLAGIYQRVGGHNEARRILKEELAKADKPLRKMTLRWQLAESYEKTGDLAEAESLLEEALADAREGAEMPAAEQRLKTFRDRKAGGDNSK